MIFTGLISQKMRLLYGLRYAEFVVALVKAITRQQAMIEQQNAQITEQQKQIDLLLKRIEALESEK